MKGLTLHCKRVASKDTRRTRKHKEIRAEIQKTVPKKYEDVLLVLTCIENGDNSPVFEKAIERILDINKTFVQGLPIVVLPFAHLSNRSAKGRAAMNSFNTFLDKLKTVHDSVHSLSFGTHKNLSLDAFGHNGSITYFEF